MDAIITGFTISLSLILELYFAAIHCCEDFTNINMQ